jgi:glycosyltransferase involved in cell wall biosynthesis
VATDLRVSVVVPTRNRPTALLRCLRALDAQEVRGEYEVVVVDDGSSVQCEVPVVVTAWRRARLIPIKPAGSAAARNRGLREARAPIVLFIDDDCEPRPDWCELLTSALESGAPVAAGRGVNADPDAALADATQTILDYITLRSRRPDGSIGFAPTYNIGCRREVGLAVPFEESYVNQGADRDWAVRLSARGHAIAFEPRAVVDHRQILDLRTFWKKHVDYGRGSARFRRRHGLGLERPPFYLELVRFAFRRGVGTGLLVCLAQLAAAVGAGKNALGIGPR